MSKKRAKRSHCDQCGENDGTVHTVALQIAGLMQSRRRLCRSCQFTVIVAFAAPHPRR